ncbi:hypothetical protein GZL_03152 [Streptomyces sp. 769]|nr:hypothetical protein GZL_03152 [Streptomyces sp. 769]
MPHARGVVIPPFGVRTVAGQRRSNETCISPTGSVRGAEPSASTEEESPVRLPGSPSRLVCPDQGGVTGFIDRIADSVSSSRGPRGRTSGSWTKVRWWTAAQRA